MKKIVFPLLLATAVSCAVANETTVCTAHGDKRTIELVTDAQGCKVNYTKAGETKMLWSSARTEYCTTHAAEFIEKQKGWGYECAAAAAADTPTPAQ